MNVHYTVQVATHRSFEFECGQDDDPRDFAATFARMLLREIRDNGLCAGVTFFKNGAVIRNDVVTVRLEDIE